MQNSLVKPKRCPWCGDDPLYVTYHDEEWGVPEWNSQALFEKLLLDGFQAGLSWITILKKRSAYRLAYDEFDPEKISRYTEKKQAELLLNAGIVRNRAKIKASIGNAQAYLRIQESGEEFNQWLWRFVDGETQSNRFRNMSEVPTETAASRAMSKALKSAGFRFCGPTICYAFMQAVGMVNDHLTSCFRYDSVISRSDA